MAEILWQVYGYGKTAQDAAREFARTHWAEPRKATGFKPDGTFKVVRGLRTYRVVESGDLWVVEVASEAKEKASKLILSNIEYDQRGGWRK